MPGPTVVQELERLRSEGYEADFRVTRDGRLCCGSCGATVEPATVSVESTVRFEGPSNPDDQAVIFALSCEPCGVKGALVTAYGSAATAEEAAVITALG